MLETLLKTKTEIKSILTHYAFYFNACTAFFIGGGRGEGLIRGGDLIKNSNLQMGDLLERGAFY